MGPRHKQKTYRGSPKVYQSPLIQRLLKIRSSSSKGRKKALPLYSPVFEAAGIKGDFNEEFWFYVGEKESELAESGEEGAWKERNNEVSRSLLQRKYASPDQLIDKEAHRLSLYTGMSQQLKRSQKVYTPLPGKRLSDREFFTEMNRSALFIRRALFAFLALGGAALFYYILF